ncbi:hypothetical protein KI387_005241, partial [Taxus chinensis]
TPKITEIQVRMDCNGCLQKIRRALQTVQGIYKVHEDMAQQKIVVVGWAEPEKVMRAIKRTGKIAKLCSHHTPEEENADTAERADAAAASSTSSATTVTQDPVEQSNQTVTEENAPAAAAAEEPAPAPVEEGAPPADAAQAGDSQHQENSDSPPPQETASVAAPDPVETYYMNIDHSNARHGYLIRNGFDGYHVAHDYPRDADYITTRYNNNPDYLDAQQRYHRYMADQYYYNNNNGSSSSGNSRQMTATDSSRFATMFSDENPNACCVS